VEHNDDDEGTTMAAPGENLKINGERLWDS
jgi:hypothetical protein